MAICKFFQQGNCRNGDRCKFEHVDYSGRSNMSSSSNLNRFAAFNNPSLSGDSRDNKLSNGNTSVVTYAGLDKENLIKDLRTEKPQWVLSCYGPGRNAPEQLFGGPMREFSFEEIRLKHYTSTNQQQTAQEVQTLVDSAERQTQVALNDLDGAIKYIVDSQHKHPNRNDIVEAINTSHQVVDPVNPILNTTAAPSAGAFGAPRSNPAFGQTSAPSAFGGGAFGKPTFGITAAPTSVGAFGQPSSLGANPNLFSTGTTSSAFGQPSSLGGGGAFGQPSVLGQKPNPFGSTTPAPFGQPQTNTAIPFGQPVVTSAATGFSTFATGASNGFSSNPTPNPFGQTSTPAFGQPSLSSTTINAPTGPSTVNGFAKPNNTFGQPSTSSAANPFSQGSNAFGQPANKPAGQMTQPAFGQSSFGQPTSGFVQNTGAFGQPSIGGAFGQPSSAGTFSQPSNPQNPLLNNNSDSNTTSNSFGARPSSSSNSNPNPFGVRPSSSSSNPFSNSNSNTQPKPFGTHQSSSNPNSLGETQQSKPQNKQIQFPNGPPPPYPATEESDDKYDEGMTRVWEGFMRLGLWEFEGGVMPLVAPKREWCSWDF